MTNVIKFPEREVPYWLCCGDLTPEYANLRSRDCREAYYGHPEHCRFGTATQHSNWQLNGGDYLELND